VLPSEVLIFFHIPKTGGQTMKGIFLHCLPDHCFDCDLQTPDPALLVHSTARIAEKFNQLSPEKQRKIRCVVGDHVAFDVATLFDRALLFPNP
jgi:hypothetical protein